MKVELIRKDSRKPKIVIDQLPVILGLDPSADVCLDDSWIGHYQCMIDQSDGALMVWDLGTKLGTHVNGVRVAKNAPLMPGDELTMGRSRFTVHYEHPEAKPPKHAQRAAKGREAVSPPAAAPGRRRQPAALAE